MVKAEINDDIDDYRINIYGRIGKEEGEQFLSNLEDVKKTIEKLMREDNKEKSNG